MNCPGKLATIYGRGVKGLTRLIVLQVVFRNSENEVCVPPEPADQQRATEASVPSLRKQNLGTEKVWQVVTKNGLAKTPLIEQI